MTTIETGETQHRSSDAERDVANVLASLRIDAERGGLVILGPTSTELEGIDTLLSSADVQPIEALSGRVSRWKTASDELTEVGRVVSDAVRNSRTAVVHLDSHTGDSEPVPDDLREFVCLRLSQLVVGVADVPAYVVLHGEHMARALIVDTLGDDEPLELGTIADGCSVWQLTSATMFPGIVVAMCPADRDATAVTPMLEWLESCRS